MSETKFTVLKVDGMGCMSCVPHVGDALREVMGVSNVEVRIREGLARVEHSADVRLADLVEALDDAGYPASPAT